MSRKGLTRQIYFRSSQSQKSWPHRFNFAVLSLDKSLGLTRFIFALPSLKKSLDPQIYFHSSKSQEKVWTLKKSCPTDLFMLFQVSKKVLAPQICLRHSKSRKNVFAPKIYFRHSKSREKCRPHRFIFAVPNLKKSFGPTDLFS